MGKKILMVDDDESLRDLLLVEQLELHEEFEPKGVSTAKQGLDLVEEEYFDVIFLIPACRIWTAARPVA